jgi:carboxypeptidase C (cathepsin A)
MIYDNHLNEGNPVEIEGTFDSLDIYECLDHYENEKTDENFELLKRAISFKFKNINLAKDVLKATVDVAIQTEKTLYINNLVEVLKLLRK